ncbi:LRRN4 C-terminal-like protein [Oryzias latipes]|nr:LRRN4 C-terminal-like protein [Oryzias latipes]XP_023818446.1 LRRN4 C-terminal-like protein [Oryzias latipes]
MNSRTTSAMRNLCFLVIISGLLPLRGSSPLPTMSGVPEDHSRLITEDYNNLEEETSAPASTHGRSSQLCDYNPCREDQISCEELRSTGCLCPWFTEEDEVPEAPTLKTVSWNGSEVVVRWCAPNSHVKAYVVTVGGQEKQELGWDKRSSAVDGIRRKAEVCVVARNDAGDSQGSCMVYQPTDSSLLLTAGLIGGGLGFLLLLLLAVLLWRSRRQKRQEAHVSMRNTDGRH